MNLVKWRYIIIYVFLAHIGPMTTVPSMLTPIPTMWPKELTATLA